MFRFRVIETFAGGGRNSEEVEVRTGYGGGDCGYGFVVGQRYLVDAYSGPNSEGAVPLTTGICSATAPEALAQIPLAELRARAARKRLPDLNGQVLSVEGYGEPKPGENHPLPGIAVTVTEQPQGTSYHAVTDEAGVYSLSSVPPGTYRVDFALPSTRVAWEGEDGKPILITIPANDGTGASCHVNIHAAPSGTIAGQVVGANGVGLKGFVAAYPAAQTDSWKWAAAAPTDGDGRFRLDFLRDGSYRIEFSAEASPQKEYRSSATVQAGQATAGLQLIVP